MYDDHTANSRDNSHGSRHAVELAAVAPQPAADLPKREDSGTAEVHPLADRAILYWHRLMCLVVLAAMLGAMSPANATDVSRQVIGTTPTLIAARAPNLIATNLSHWSAARLATLSNYEMAAIYYASPQSYSVVYSISATQGTRMHSVSRIGMTTFAPPTTGVNNTLYEIYLDYRTAPTGALTAEAAVYETAVYAAKNLAVAYYTGQAIGSAVHWLIETYAPSLDDKIGGTLDSVLYDIEHGEVIGSSVAYWEWALDDWVFSVPLYDMAYGADLGGYGVLDDAIGDFEGGFCLGVIC